MADWPLNGGHVAVTLHIINGVGFVNSIWCNGVPETSGAVGVKDYAASKTPIGRSRLRVALSSTAIMISFILLLRSFGSRSVGVVSVTRNGR